MKNKTNKLRNAFLITSFCLLNTISYAQTKEETISWLKEKFGNYLIVQNDWSNPRLISINECEITFMVHYKNRFGNTGSHDGDVKFIIPTEGIKVSQVFQENPTLNHKNEVITQFYSNGKIYYSSTSALEIRDGEDDIYDRMQKALDHLATFCPKKKETF